MSDYTAYLRGTSFRGIEAQAIAQNLIEGQELVLQREPSNAFDENAIAVLDPETQIHIGYVAKEVAADLAPEMDAGTEFTCRVDANMMKSIILYIAAIEPPALGENDLA